MLKKLMALLLAGSVCMGVLASCAKEDGNGGDTTASGTVRGDAAVSETETAVPDDSDFENADFGGTEFKILYRTSGADEYYVDTYIGSEGAATDAVSEAVKERNGLVEQKYNVRITTEKCSSPMEEASARMNAGQVDFELICDLGTNMRDAALDGKLYDVHKLDIAGMGESRWVPNAVEGLTVDGKMFVFTNMISPNSVSWAKLYLFNKNLMDKYGITYPYEYVDAGNWTYDVLLEMITKAEDDVDGDGVIGEADVQGGISGAEILEGAIYEPFCDVVDGKYKFIGFTEGMVAAYNKYKERCNKISYFDIEDYYLHGSTVHPMAPYMHIARGIGFGEDHMLFLPGTLDMTKEFAEMESDYGIAPVPVRNAGDEYRTAAYYGVPMFAIPADVADPDMTALVLDYMAYESERLLLPAVYDTTIMTKRVHDTRDLAMIDIVRNSVVYDWSEIYLTEIDEYRTMRIRYFTGSFGSVAARYFKKAQEDIDTVITTIRSIG